jgi:hypothetical protein
MRLCVNAELFRANNEACCWHGFAVQEFFSVISVELLEIDDVYKSVATKKNIQ